MALERSARTLRYDDLFDLPDDGRRYEIVEGELFELPAPGLLHALVVSNLMWLLAGIVRAMKGTIVTAPVDVFFRGADPVEPDVVVLLPGGTARPSRRGVEGPPDLLIEVLSPSTRGRDLLMKRMLYARAGVREYWIVDPDARTVDEHTLDVDVFREPVTVGGDGRVVSPLLATELAAAEVFAGLDEAPDEG